jgi:hypothetical protein
VVSFIPGERNPQYPLLGAWVGPRADLDMWRRDLLPCLGVEHFIRRPACGLVAILTELSQVGFKRGDFAELRHLIEEM